GEVLFDRVDLIRDPLKLAQGLALARTQDTVNNDWHLSSRSLRIRCLWPSDVAAPWPPASRAHGSQWLTLATVVTCHGRRDTQRNRAASPHPARTLPIREEAASSRCAPRCRGRSGSRPEVWRRPARPCSRPY